MDTVHFGCTRCGSCCRASIPLGLAEALDHDRDFLLALVLRAQTWNLGDFSKNRPEIPLSHDELLTTLAFRKDKLALEPSRDTVFQVGRLKSSGERVVTFMSVGAAALGVFESGAARCARLEPDNSCRDYAVRPLACRLFPLDPLYPEMLQNVPLRARQGRTGCDFSEQAPILFADGRVQDPALRQALLDRQEAIRRDSLFLPFWGRGSGRFPGLPGLSGVLEAVRGNGVMDLPFAPALVFLVAAGQLEADRAEECLRRQCLLLEQGVAQALARRDKAERARTAVMRNSLDLARALTGGVGVLARELAETMN